MANEPPFNSETFWLEVDGRHDPEPVALITCRVCGVHHVIPRDEYDNPLTLAAVLDLARTHRCSGGY